MNLKSRVLKAIEHKGCEIPDLAKAAGVKTPSVHGWINGTSHSMKAGPAIRAATYLDVDALWLAEGDGEMLPARLFSPAAVAKVTAAMEPDALPYLHADPIIRQVIALMEKTDPAGRGIALMAASEAIEKYRPVNQTAKSSQ